ncbi:sarcosine oxidase subunit gamma [Aureimonas psammosilenae]|uniref:sarcosine oxidase subunit gamma n=1 Tax=Aureimonas psammosilenae TaxID=2495496 RepID=UPI0012610308|nr:sarcosine oxidase subunit gamma family protein [Aureimonas psammosilenae]
MVEASSLAAIRALSPLDGHYHGGLGLSLTPAAPRALVSLRVSEEALSPVGRALGLELPIRPKATSEANGLAALWLGPDEFLLLSETWSDEAARDLVSRIEGSGTSEQSAVDVSDRFVGMVIDGVAAQAVLSAACPRDLRLAAFPMGAASRTVLAKADILLWRRGETRFELFCGRSFADYVWAYLVEASRAPAV